LKEDTLVRGRLYKERVLLEVMRVRIRAASAIATSFLVSIVVVIIVVAAAGAYTAMNYVSKSSTEGAFQGGTTSGYTLSSSASGSIITVIHNGTTCTSMLPVYDNDTSTATMLCHTYSSYTGNSDNYNYVQLYGSVLPFLSNATYVGPANTSRPLIISFFPASDAPGSLMANLTTWERSVGIIPGVQQCPSAEGVNDTGGTTVYWTTTYACSTDMSESLTTIGVVESALNVTINFYSYEGQFFYAIQDNPWLPNNVAPYVVMIGDLDNFTSGGIV
jgi:hypothetical protein